MKYVIILILMLPYFVQVHMDVMNTGVQEQVFEQFTHALESASHDASLDVQDPSLSEGNILFDQAQADTDFHKTLATDLGLVPNTLEPLPGNILKQGVQILDEEFIDYSDATFPYHYVNGVYGVDVTMTQPSVVYVVQIQIPSIEPGQTGFTRIWKSVQSYPGN